MVSNVNNQLASAREKKILGIVCGIAITAVLAATLWPFNPFLPTEFVG